MLHSIQVPTHQPTSLPPNHPPLPSPFLAYTHPAPTYSVGVVSVSQEGGRDVGVWGWGGAGGVGRGRWVKIILTNDTSSLAHCQPPFHSIRIILEGGIVHAKKTKHSVEHFEIQADTRYVLTCVVM